jgi:hypothetical protein
MNAKARRDPFRNGIAIPELTRRDRFEDTDFDLISRLFARSCGAPPPSAH